MLGMCVCEKEKEKERDTGGRGGSMTKVQSSNNVWTIKSLKKVAVSIPHLDAALHGLSNRSIIRGASYRKIYFRCVLQIMHRCRGGLHKEGTRVTN
jgi:hypothetical protein